jgi:DNA-binding phage protein
MAKPRENKFTPHAEEILGWFEAEPELRLRDAVERIAALGVRCTRGELSTFLARHRDQDERDRMLMGIASGAEKCRELDEAFAANPAPELALIVKLLKTLVINMGLNPQTPADLYDRAIKLLKPVTEFAKLEAKREDLKLAERRVAILEQRESKAREIIGDQTLTPEQQTAKFREIFGLAA